MKLYSNPSRKPMMYGGMASAKPKKKMMGGTMDKKPIMMGGMTDKKMMAKGGMPMVEKDGKKMPAFAADGKGKMMYGGKAKKK